MMELERHGPTSTTSPRVRGRHSRGNRRVFARAWGPAFIAIFVLVTGSGIASAAGPATTPVSLCTADKSGLLSCRIGSRGGTFVFSELRTVLVVPKGAVKGNLTLTGAPVVPPTGPLLVAGTGIDLEPATGWKAPLTLSIGYDPAALPVGLTEADLAIFGAVGDGSWQLLPGSTVDAGSHTVTITVSSLGRFAVGGSPPAVAAVAISPASVTVPYVGPAGTAAWTPEQLTAQVTDAGGNTLDRAVSWSSSDTATATVDSTGTISGVAPGAASVTATVDGISDTVSVCVGGAVAAVDLQPGDGPQLDPLPLAATATASCGQTQAPFRYFWSCQGTNSQACNDFLTATGGISGGFVSAYQFPLGAYDAYNIGVQACLYSCSHVIRSYSGLG